jgi:hypothetical protein
MGALMDWQFCAIVMLGLNLVSLVAFFTMLVPPRPAQRLVLAAGFCVVGQTVSAVTYVLQHMHWVMP